VRFRRKVVPGDQIIYQLKILKRKSKLFKIEGKAFVDDALAAEAVLLATFS
ncbi:MAG: 3-hydroxyacyl-[acyl-carrier-protein] dehydratase FabZ, partial [Desulfobulbaceae bacterium]|nr:3-hydroxyacyl-[acyl-carrier-protein] dehydratase FabZ [Desulfobulbaceae bacterium]